MVQKPPWETVDRGTPIEKRKPKKTRILHPFLWVILTRRMALLLMNLIVLAGVIYLYSYFSHQLPYLRSSLGAFFNYALGNMYIKERKTKKAILAYKRALKLNPKMAICYYRLAIIYDDLGRHYEADICYEKFKKLRPKSKKLQELKAYLNKK